MTPDTTLDDTPMEEPIVPVHPYGEERKPKSFLETSAMLLLVRKPETYLRSLADLLTNIALAVSGPIALMIHEGKVGDWEDLSAFPVVISLLPTVAAVMRQWLGRSPGDVDGGQIRDAIRGK